MTGLFGFLTIHIHIRSIIIIMIIVIIIIIVIIMMMIIIILIVVIIIIIIMTMNIIIITIIPIFYFVTDNWQKISPHRTIQNKTNPGLPLILRSTNMKPLRPGAYVENIDENGNYVTPDVAHTAQTRGPHTKISPEDSIIRLISSKIISNGSPKTSINLKKGLKRMRTVSHNDLIPSSSSISSVVSDGIAARMITPTLATSTSTSLSLSISRISNIMSDNPLTSFAIEAEALAEADQKVEEEEEKKIAVTRDEHDSKKRKILTLSEAPSILQIEESKKIIVSTCTCLVDKLRKFKEK